ncbi:hypothetical protein [Paenibacillus algicola]|nr:hypothetical protein [Paenibacillus algicola]
MEKGKNPDPSSLPPVFLSRHYSDFNKVVTEKVEMKIEGSTVL